MKWKGVIPPEAFARRENILSVVFPEDVIVIGRSCFDECVNLKHVTFPPKLHTIGASAFYACKSIAELNLPSSVREIHDGAFRSCVSLHSFTFPPKLKKSLKKFGKNGVFHNCNLLPQTLKDGWEVHLDAADFAHFGSKIPKEAFLDRKDIKSVGSLPDHILEICEGAFNGCWNMEQIHLPQHLKVIGRSAFNNCSRLTEVVVPGSVDEIRDFAFVACCSLTSLIILRQNDQKRKIALGSNVFKMCVYLKEVSAPDQVLAAIKDGALKEYDTFRDLPLNLQKKSSTLQLAHFWWRFQQQRLSACQRNFIANVLLVSDALATKEFEVYSGTRSESASEMVELSGGTSSSEQARAAAANAMLPAMPTEIWLYILTFVLKCELGRHVVFD